MDGLQQVPELVELFKKEYVGRNRGAGKFLTTVTADTPFCDELVGGVSMDLYPPSQGELGLLRRPADFLECLLRASFRDGESWIGSDEVLLRAIKGGYLGSVLAVDFEARGLFFEDYIDKSHLSDFLVEEGFEASQLEGLMQLLSRLAASSGGLLNRSSRGKELGEKTEVIESWLKILERVRLVRRLRNYDDRKSNPLEMK